MTHKKEAPADQDRAGAIRSLFKTAIDIVAPYMVIIALLAFCFVYLAGGTP